jgi:hypothetical protein
MRFSVVESHDAANGPPRAATRGGTGQFAEHSEVTW